MSPGATTFTRMTAQQQRQWDQDGYLIVRDAIPAAQVQRLLDEFDRLDGISQSLGRAADAPLDAMSVIDGAVENLFAQNDGAAIHTLDSKPSDVFLDLIDHPAHLGMVCQTLGAAIHMSWSHLMLRPASKTPANRWHQDGPKPYLFPRVAGQMALQWVRVGWFLTDLQDHDMGNLCLIPGSHRSGFPRVPAGLDRALKITSFSNFKQVEQLDGDVPGAVQITARAGDIILLHNALYHCVVRNTSNVPRKNLYFVYTPVWQRLGDRDASSPDLVARCDPVRQQLLGALSGPNTNGGRHCFDQGLPLVKMFHGTGFQQTWESLDEDYIRRTQA